MGRFREDLYHRLRVIHIQMPALSELEEDFDTTIHRTLKELTELHHRSILGFEESVAQLLEAYDWPGNYRELRNVLEFAVLSALGSTLTLKDLPEWFLEQNFQPIEIASEYCPTGTPLFQLSLEGGYHEVMRGLERAYLQRALDQNKRGINRTAQKIGMAKATLIRRIRSYGLNVKKYWETEEGQAAS